MNPKAIPLTHVFDYTEVDQRFWDDHLQSWVPDRIIDAHIHINDPIRRIEPLSEELKQLHWAYEVGVKPDLATAEHCVRTTYPNRDVRLVAFGNAGLEYDVEKSNEDLWIGCPSRGWHSLAVVRPSWVAEQIEWLLDQPGVIGVKPYYTLVGFNRADRNSDINYGIFDFLPHHQLEVLNARRAWVTLHVPRVDRLGDPRNISEIREIRRLYSRVKLMIAHLGRCYTLEHAREGLLPWRDDEEIYFDNSAVLNPAVHLFALRHIGPSRILYGSDNPMFYMRGRQLWIGRKYQNFTSYPFNFNKTHEPACVERSYTLYMYEALQAIGFACEQLSLDSKSISAMFHDNAAGLISDILRR